MNAVRIPTARLPSQRSPPHKTYRSFLLPGRDFSSLHLLPRTSPTEVPCMAHTAAQYQLNNIPKEEGDGKKFKVALIGSGNWGSVAAKLVASNTLRFPAFHDEVRMWVYEEALPSGEKISAAINRSNVIPPPILYSRNPMANLYVNAPNFLRSHRDTQLDRLRRDQHHCLQLYSTEPQMLIGKENAKYLPGIKLGKNVVADPDLEHAVKDANMLVFMTPHQFVEGVCKRLVGKIKSGVEAISLIKGMEVKKEGPRMISLLISEMLGINCCVLMGPNIANEIAAEKFTEATVGYRKDKEIAERWVQLFSTPYFVVNAVQDIEGVELCGTLKNVVAIAAVGGRNRKVAEAFARNGGKRSFEELEEELLQGQKLQGVLTTKEVFEVISGRGWQELFPLFTTLYEICIGRLPPNAIFKYQERRLVYSTMEGSDQCTYP
ncbi:hypothetical protein ACLOJK_012025 [Asimina triloba]